MKLTALLITIACLQVSASVFAQINLSKKNAPLIEVLNSIEQQSGYAFMYKVKVVENIKVNADLHNATLQQALNQVLSGQALTYEVIDKTVAIKSNEKITSDNVKAFLATPVDVHGRVTDTLGKPMIGASVKIKSNRVGVVTNNNGEFDLRGVEVGTVLQISYVSYITVEFTITKENSANVNITLREGISKLQEISVVSNGYQTIPKERATGSFAQVNNELLNRRVSADILSRLEGVVPGLLFNRNTSNSAGGHTDISIRGTNTLFANNQPLIVLDNFPYDGDINNINPNDIENITVLKDAAAASIWGVQSGNGVIVITSKKGKRDQKLLAEFNANVTIGDKPDLYYGHNFIKSNDFINIEQNLFSKGFYDSDLKLGYVPVTPVVQLLADARSGKITSAQANAQISLLNDYDIRDQENKYLYQRSINQQYAINLRGGNNNSDYVFSLGQDQNSSFYKGNHNNRTTVNTSFNFYPVKNLQLTAGINYIKSSAVTDNPIYNGSLNINGHTIYPYAQIADANGNALSIAKDYSLNYVSTVNNQLLDWNYRPLDELNSADNRGTLYDNRINIGVQYDFLNHFSINIKYQYEHSIAENQRYYSIDSYYARNLINEYTQISSSGVLTHPLPIGGILQLADGSLNSQRGRTQINYSNSWDQKHELNALVGTEISETINGNNSSTAYGYNKDTKASIGTIDYADYFTITPSRSGLQIPNTTSFGKTTDRYLSYFGNAAYTYQGKYVLSASGRIDRSNLFGVNTNQKAVPLFSTGLAWNLSKEAFYHVSWLPYIKMRATYGYTGNINKSATAVTTISQQSNDYFTGGPYAVIANPGNPELRWEKVRMMNFGFDYAIKSEIISGSFDYYVKRGIDLFGNSPLAPSTGLTTFFGNTADTKGNGMDIVINTRNINGNNFKWTSNFSLSHVVDIVTKYDVQLTSSSYINGSNASNIQPLTGKLLYALYSYNWGGLTHNTGDPQGYVNGVLSTDYSTILAKTPIGDMVYNGSSRPLTYGYLRNTFSYRSLSLSANIIYKLDYYFRRSSFTSSGLPYNTNTDYYKRWQNPGDESNTTVPSFQYPFNTNRDVFYQNSSVLIDKGDHIRLQDITLGYDIDAKRLKRMGISSLQLFGYINNVGILWRANKDQLDPDLSTNYANALPLPRTIAFGLKAKF